MIYTAPPLAHAASLPSAASALTSPWTIRGRIGRARFISYYLLGSLAHLLVALGTQQGLIALTGQESRFDALLFLPLIAYFFMVTVRRLNDGGDSGWWALGHLIPYASLLLMLWLMCNPGMPGANRYGRPPAPNSALVIAGAWAAPVLTGLAIAAWVALTS